MKRTGLFDYMGAGMFTNYHTHTFRCGHAGSFPDEEYVLEAISCGMDVLGFTDHIPWPYISDFRQPKVRMDTEAFPDYIASVLELKEKYKDRIKILVGLECEYFPCYLSWLKEQKERLDYLILGNHWSPNNEYGEPYFGRASDPKVVQQYFHYTLEGMKTGLFAYVAHPDLVLMNYPEFDQSCIDGSYALCRKAKELDIPLEYNLQGIRHKEKGKATGLGYPYAGFWEIAKEVGCKAIIGYDVHNPKHLSEAKYLEYGKEYLEKLGIQVIDHLEL